MEVLEGMFDTIDLSRNGFVTADQLHEFCEALFCIPVCVQHVEGAIELVCGSSGMVSKKDFLDVLTDIEKRRTLDQHAYWDFQGLDYTGCNRISLHNALLLFKEYHDDKFSLVTWKEFLSSRESPEKDVCFDEIRFWLCDPPTGTPCNEKKFKEEENTILMRQTNVYVDEYNHFKQKLTDDHTEIEDHNEHQLYHARRKLNKWNKQGLEALLFDDGLDGDGAEVKIKSRNEITMIDLNELLEIKYETLKEKLMLEMARHAAVDDDELKEVLEQIHRKVRNLVRDGFCNPDELPGGSVQMLSSLTGLMGELRLHDKEHRRQIEDMKTQLKEKGKSLQEISIAVQQHYEQIIAGDGSCATLLLQLHKRYKLECETLMSTLKMDQNQPLEQAMVLEYARLMRQVYLIEEEHSFVAIATSVGLAERAMEPRFDRSDWDRSRSERLAQIRIQDRLGVKQVYTSHEFPDIDSFDRKQIVDIQMEIVKEITHKHFYEREQFIHMLFGKVGMEHIEQARRLKPDDRKNKLKSLQNQHITWKSSSRIDKSVLHGLLLQAMCLKYVERQLELEASMDSKLSADEMQEVLLADLQQQQGIDFENVLHDLQKMKHEHLVAMFKKECAARIEEYYDNIAYVVLGAREISQDDKEYIKVLEDKYEILRKRIFLMAVKDKVDWKNLSRQDKTSMLQEIVDKEKLLRSEGRFQEMEDLGGPKATAKILPTLRSLIGEDKAEYHKRKLLQKADEDHREDIKVMNVLADLVPRFENEQEFLLSWLHSPEAKGLSLRTKGMKIVEIKVETYRADLEEDFEIAALSTGLLERVQDTLTQRHDSDVERQKELARKRVLLRRNRLLQNEEFFKEPKVSDNKIPQKGNITGLQVVYVHEMLKRHCHEREVILTHLQDESIDDLIAAASTMTEDERQRRLVELHGKRQNLNLSTTDGKEEHICILEEAAALCAVSTKQQLVAEGKTASMDAICIELLAELQEEQDKEVALTLDRIENMNEEDIRKCLKIEMDNYILGTVWNVMTILTHCQGEATDDLLLKALESKYTVLRKKLLEDSLRVRMGTHQWEELSQNEKQQKLIMLDTQALQQIKIGQISPLLLGDDFKLQARLAQIMGICQHVFWNKVKGQQIAGIQSNLKMDEDTGVVIKGEANPLKELYVRLEEEKLALNRQFKGQSEEHFGPTERQIQLARYHREAMIANEKDTFVTMATYVGLMERQQEEIKFRVIDDPQRYLAVAKKIIEEEQCGKHKDLTSEVPKTRSVVDYVDHIMIILENKHIKERELFCRLLSSIDKYEDIQLEVSMCSHRQWQNKIAELKALRNKSVKERKCENLELLTEATLYKAENRRKLLSEHKNDASHEDISCSLMASVLEFQNSEAQRLIKILSLKTLEGLCQEENKILEDMKNNMADNIAAVVLFSDPSDGTTYTDLIEALQGKYDALKDKLLAEALIKELGESEWNCYSEKQRQKKVFQFKLKERQLRKEGKFEEANALIAELLKDKQTLQKLMGETVLEQKQKLQEQMKRRKERLSQGMSEDEVNKLERQEMEENNNNRKKERNILADLEQRFEHEKEEMLRRLEVAGNDLDKEQEIQACLARLKRDQRLAEQEDNFNSAALIVGLAEKRDLQHTKYEERHRQEKLAYERLRASQQGNGKNDQVLDYFDNETINTEDKALLHDVIINEIDRIHQLERQIFIKLMNDSTNSKQRKIAKFMTEEDRNDKLYELKELYKNWKNSNDKDLQEKMDILKEAVNFKLEMVKYKTAPDGKEFTEDDLQITLLADLQELQKATAQKILNDIEKKDLSDLQQVHKGLCVITKSNNHNNIATVLLEDRSMSKEEQEEERESEGLITKASVLKVLEDKYDAVKDKLMIEALIKQLGEREWAQLSEKQRQRKIIDLKLRERKLRREGKLDEIANIIGIHLENEKLLDDFMVENEQSQRKRFEKRMKRRKELLTQRQSEGLITDDITIEAILDKEECEEQKLRRRNILEELNKNFDDEKAKVLRVLSYQTDKVAQERQRQIDLAKLKHDERRMKKSNKLNEIMMIINSSREQDKKRDQSIIAEKERQCNVARERLEARKKMKNQGKMDEKELEAKLAADEKLLEINEAAKDVEGLSVHEALLSIVESKHEQEMDLLPVLLDLAKTDTASKGKPDDELKSDLAQYQHDQIRWKKHSTQQLLQRNGTNWSTEESIAHQAKNKSHLLKLLTNALVCRLEIERRLLQKTKPELMGEPLEEELKIFLITDLQEKHAAEVGAIQKLMDEEDDEVLKEIRRNQLIAFREGWFDNLAHTIFHISHLPMGSEEIERINESITESIKELEQEMEADIEKALVLAHESGTEFDEEAVRCPIVQQFENKKQQLISQKNEQKEAILRKLEARRSSKELHIYEEQTRRNLLQQIQEHRQNNEEQDNGKQSNVLQQKLAERHKARKAAEKITRPKEGGTAQPPNTPMRREKTVVNIDVTEQQKHEIISKMVRDQLQLQKKIDRQKDKQKEMLQRRLESRKGEQSKEAAEIFSLGQRQQTILEKTKQDDKERQLQKMQEKISHVREKREPSAGEKHEPSAGASKTT